jgi:hypothetical protein
MSDIGPEVRTASSTVRGCDVLAEKSTFPPTPTIRTDGAGIAVGAPPAGLDVTDSTACDTAR